jgi:two-component system chemotaxis response regulator CheB
VDVLFRSAVAVYGGKILAVVMTGMGQDGFRGCELIRERGGQIVVQDEASSVVWGMPGYVAHAGLADKIVPLNQIAGEITRRTQAGRSTAVHR